MTDANPFDLTGRVAIVTGGGTGIGAGTARVLAQNGADVVLASRRLENLEKVAAEIVEATGRHCLPLVTDIRDEASVVHMADHVAAEFGRIDILVNNAGGAVLLPLEDMPTETWDKIFAVNLRGAFLCTREVGRHMLAAGQGSIINISSGAGVTGTHGGAHYSAAKAGLQMFTRVTAGEWGPRGVRANCIAVGLIATEKAVDAWAAAEFDPSTLADQLPLRRTGTPDDIAWSVLYLASDASSFVTGQTYAVDGGPIFG